MSRVNMADKYIILVQHGQGFCHVSDSTNSREVAFRLAAHRALNKKRLHTNSTVPTFYIMENIAHQRAEPKPAKKPRYKRVKLEPNVIIVNAIENPDAPQS